MKKHSILLFMILFSYTTMAQWQLISSEYGGFAIDVIDENKVFVAYENGIIYSTADGGETWSSYQVEALEDCFCWFNDIYFPTENVGYACGGSYYGVVKKFIIKTTDGGQTWESLTAPSDITVSPYAFNGLYFIDENVGFVYGPGNGFWKTEDGGNSYTLIDNNNFYVRDIHFTPSNVGYISSVIPESDSGVIQKSVDYGNIWTTLTNPSIDYLVGSMFFVGETIYAISGGYPHSRFLKSTNEGMTWTETTFIEPFLSALWFTSEDVGYLNINQEIYQTQNGGQTWTAQEIIPESHGNIREIAFANENVGFALGTDGIYRTTNGGGLKTNAISKMNLKIYPNPVSEKINLEFDSNLNIQSVRLVDMSGRIIKTYLEDFEAIDIQGLAKGNYILKVFSDKGIQTEKIVVK
ncbi:MAG: YCF48-related protein [Flavobacteriaceae bacterium]